METRQPVDLKELSLIARSKRELYLVLLNDCKIYMPLIQDINEGYIRDVFAGSIKVLYTIIHTFIYLVYKEQ